MKIRSIMRVLFDRLLKSMGRHNILQAALMVASVVTSATAWLYLYRAQRRRQLVIKMQVRGQRAKRDMNELKAQLRTLEINTAIPTWSFKRLQEALQTGKVTASEVLRAYQAKALDVNDKTNAITDIIKSAPARAAQLDALPAEQRGPLHGIPVSLKETCGLEGLDCTCGFGEVIDIPMKTDSSLVKVLKSKGAVPFIRTNIPQGMRSFATFNGIFGETRNPYNSDRGCAGSSGGEGAMIGGQGSILGVGSDLGGSARVPAHFCGHASFKQTAGRLGNLGNFNVSTVNGQTLVLTTDAPMGRDVTSLVHFMRAVLGPSLWELEPTVPPMVFNEEMFSSNRPLRVGYFVSDHCTRPVPAVERAVLLAASTLESLGHKVVEIDIGNYTLLAFSEHLFKLLSADKGQAYKDLLTLKEFVAMCKMPDWLRPVIAKVSEFAGDSVSASVLKAKQIRTIPDWLQQALDLQEFQQEFFEEWKRQNLDVVIGPVWPSPANSGTVVEKLTGNATYTCLWSVVNFPAGVVPVTKVTESDVTKTLDPNVYPAKTMQEKLIQADARGSEGLPVAVQVAGLPYTEELVLRVMAELEAAILSKHDGI